MVHSYLQIFLLLHSMSGGRHLKAPNQFFRLDELSMNYEQLEKSSQLDAGKFL